MIRYGAQEITKADILEVKKVLKSDFLTQGPLVPKFEDTVKKYCGAKYAVAVNSATSALHIACLSLNLGPKDIAWTSPNTFVSTANCVIHCGAKIDFVDIDPKTYNMCTEALSLKLEKAEKQGKLPKIVIPVHFAGQSCDMVKIQKLSKKYGFKIIEDASHGIGASYNDHKVGSCIYSDITVFSFHPVKIITTGEGGMAITNNKKIYEKLYRLRTHGITSNNAFMEQRPSNEIWNYQQIELGFNFRMTDIHAALGISQMNRLDEYVNRRNEIARKYNNALINLPITIPYLMTKNHSSYHLYPICVRNNIKTQREIYNFLWSKDIRVNLHYIPVHRQPFYEKFGFKSGDFPISEQFHREVISIPIYPSLKNRQQTFVIENIKKAFSN